MTRNVADTFNEAATELEAAGRTTTRVSVGVTSPRFSSVRPSSAPRLARKGAFK
jgi:hypothetical protein